MVFLVAKFSLGQASNVRTKTAHCSHGIEFARATVVSTFVSPVVAATATTTVYF